MWYIQLCSRSTIHCVFLLYIERLHNSTLTVSQRMSVGPLHFVTDLQAYLRTSHCPLTLSRQKKKWKYFSCPTLPDFWKSSAFGNSQICPFVLLVRAICRYRWVRNTGGIILTGENQIPSRNTCPCATLPKINITRTNQGPNPGLQVGRSATSHLSPFKY